MSAKKAAFDKSLAVLPPGVSRAADPSSGPIFPVAVPGPPPTVFVKTGSAAAKAGQAEDMLLVCLQDPFEGIAAGSSKIFQSKIQVPDNNSDHQWRLETTMEMYPKPERFFESWATRGSVTLDLRMVATVREDAGHWGGNVQTTTSPGQLRVLVMRGLDNKVKFSLLSGATQAHEKKVPRPDDKRFLNADIGFEVNGEGGITFAATSVISSCNGSRLIAGSQAATKGMAFDGKWRSNLDADDGDSLVSGSWAFSIMSRQAYGALCSNQNWPEHIIS
ncbi:MAG: hypothetical protein V4689_12780 [Verrucomicrobiota bacterium]